MLSGRNYGTQQPKVALLIIFPPPGNAGFFYSVIQSIQWFFN